VLHRAHTREAPVAHKAAGGKAWDTVKPLGRHFRNLGRVVLIDDDAFKAVPGEEANQICIPCWGRDEPADDPALLLLVDALLSTLGRLGPADDLREHTRAVQEAVAGAWAAWAAAQRPPAPSGCRMR
ncbi:hypothetical protein WJX81_005932, partial [Elliptochloris bilobata]